MKRAVALVLSAVVLNLCISWAIALIAPPSTVSADGALDRQRVEQHLAFTFGDGLEWRDDEPYPLEGSAGHGAFVRRASVSGWTADAEPIRHSERVLKVGWPFTTVRTFVRQVGSEREVEGGILLSGPERSRPDELTVLPVQIVWPGLVINSGLLALVLGMAVGARNRIARRRSAPV